MRAKLVSGAVVAAAALIALGEGEAKADATCVLTATPVMSKTTSLFASASSTDAFAAFTGQKLVLTATISGAGRARVRTGGGFRLEGFVDVVSVPLFLTKNVAVVEGHVWLGGGRAVTVMGAKSDALEVEVHAPPPLDMTVRANVTCPALSMEPTGFKHPSPPGEARGFRTRKVPLAIAAEPGGASIFKVTGSGAKDTLLFFSTERRDQQVHVLFAGDVVIDGWAAASDLEALPEGEILDSLPAPRVTTSGSRLSMQGTPTTVKVKREIPLYAQAKDGADKLGAIETDTEVLVIDTVAGWSSVLPTTLAIMPSDGRSFWVRAADLK